MSESVNEVPAWPTIDPTEGSEVAPAPDAPRLSARARTRWYVAGLIVTALSGLTIGTVAIVVPLVLGDDPDRALLIVGAVTSLVGLIGTAFGTISSGLGVAFRPTR